MALEPATTRIVDLLEQMAAGNRHQPEQLLSMDLDEQERAYIVRLLTREQPFVTEDRDGHARELCQELAAWLRATLQKHAGADLQQQILEAGRLGNTTLLMELMRLKQEMEKKRTGF
jgi:hypothetical protein